MNARPPARGPGAGPGRRDRTHPRRSSLLLLLLTLGACTDPGVSFDSYPITLARAPQGGLLTTAELHEVAGPFPMLVDTGTPLTTVRDTSGRKPQVDARSFRLFGADSAAPMRADFTSVPTLAAPLWTVGGGADVVQLGGVLGVDVLRWFSVAFSFGTPSMTFWPSNSASDSFLASASFAVLHFELYGGGELDGRGEADALGMRGPIQVGATRIVLRGCAAPAAFTADTTTPVPCCARGQESAPSLVDGADVALLLATGFGPTVLGQTAWARVEATGTTTPATGPETIAWPGAETPLQVLRWVTVPRLALVDLQAGSARNPGACVELARARRLEQIDLRQLAAASAGQTTAACVQPCDGTPDNPRIAQDSAAYLELGGGGILVAVVADSEPLLQALRMEVRSRGPEVDGILGAAALGPARLEIDYKGDTHRAIFSCEAATGCRAVGRCTALPNLASQHSCFGNGWHSLPATCEADSC